MKKTYAIFYSGLICGIVLMCGVRTEAQTRITNAPGAYSFEMPEGFFMPQEAAGTAVTLKKQNVLSSMVPTITMSIVPLEDALQQYEEREADLRRARYDRTSGMRLLRKSSLKTKRDIPGWELTCLKNDHSGKPAYVIFALLDRDAENMLIVTGST
ncbi:MAG: hypothetical protein PHG65_03850, partial [Kiritimatiellae bacterium]|nr:hypothetical protein [Kiritimatiellia bacterium]